MIYDGLLPCFLLGRFMNCGSEAHICAILILVVMRRTHVGQPRPLCRTEPVTVLVDMEFSNENCSSDSSVTVYSWWFDLWISAQGWWMLSSYGTPVIKMTNYGCSFGHGPLSVGEQKLRNVRLAGFQELGEQNICWENQLFPLAGPRERGRPKDASLRFANSWRYAIRSKSWES